jgi:plasmid stabilization system protein ParE
MTYSVRFTEAAEQDLLRLFDFPVEQDITDARHAKTAIAKGIEFLSLFPFSCRKTEGSAVSPFLRELLIPSGSAGYVALFEIEDAKTATILAVRHQREEDYH